MDSMACASLAPFRPNTYLKNGPTNARASRARDAVPPRAPGPPPRESALALRTQNLLWWMTSTRTKGGTSCATSLLLCLFQYKTFDSPTNERLHHCSGLSGSSWSWTNCLTYPVARCYKCIIVYHFPFVIAALSATAVSALRACCTWIITACLHIIVRIGYCGLGFHVWCLVHVYEQRLLFSDLYEKVHV